MHTWKCVNLEWRYSRIFKELAQFEKNSNTKFTFEEILDSVKKLNSGKASDEYGLFAEHLKLAEEVITPVLVKLFNQIMEENKTPKQFKTVIIKPVCKNGTDNKILNSYRGITVPRLNI